MSMLTIFEDNMIVLSDKEEIAVKLLVDYMRSPAVIDRKHDKYFPLYEDDNSFIRRADEARAANHESRRKKIEVKYETA